MLRRLHVDNIRAYGEGDRYAIKATPPSQYRCVENPGHAASGGMIVRQYIYLGCVWRYFPMSWFPL